MEPIFKFVKSGNDYTRDIAKDGLKPAVNDVDADGSGRDTLDALMWRSRVARKDKWTVSFLRLSAERLAQLESDMDADFVDILMLDPKTNTQTVKTYYSSGINRGIQRRIGGKTVYDGVTFNITER